MGCSEFFERVIEEDVNYSQHFDFISASGEMVGLRYFQEEIALGQYLHFGWNIEIVIRKNATLIGVLENGTEKALWFFDRGGRLLATDFDHLDDMRKCDVEGVLIDGISLCDSSTIMKSFQAEWARNAHLLNADTFAKVVEYHLSNIELAFFDHSRDDLIETILQLVNPNLNHEIAPNGTIGDPSLFLNAVGKGKIEVVNPVSGSTLCGTKCIFKENNHLIYPVHCESESAFLIAVGSAIIFPAFLYAPQARRLSSTNREPLASNSVQYLRDTIHHMLQSYGAICPYLQRPGGRASGFIFISHIGHHMWNELTGLEEAEEAAFLERLDHLYSLWPDHGEHFGNVDALFQKEKDYVIRIREGIFPKCAYDANEFVVRLGGGYVRESLTKRVVEYSYKKESDFAASSRLLMKNFDYTILISHRLENRTWLNQFEETVECVDRLLDEGLKICLVFDGHNNNNSSAGFFRSHEENLGRSIPDEEQDLVHRYSSYFGNRVGLINNIGGSVARSIILADLSSFFIMPWGAGLAKYKWGAGAWGVLASNKYCLSQKGDRFIYEEAKYVQNGVADIWYDPNEVEDEVVWNPGVSLIALDRGDFRTVPGTLLQYVLRAISRVQS